MPTPAPKPAPLTGNVLIIDDDPFMSDLYGARLASAGLTVRNAYDGLEGLEAVQKEKPDLILLDVLMPRLDGFETLHRLKKDKATSSIPVIMLTSLGQREDIDRGIRDGAADYLIKASTLPTDALAKIRRLLEKKP